MKSLSIAFCCTVLLGNAAMLVGVARGAEITYDPEPPGPFDCDIHIIGQITEGDADRFKAALDQSRQSNDPQSGELYFWNRVCLNSNGGSFPEALEIAEMLHGEHGTAVPANASCLSACAIIFMAGADYEGEGGANTNRVLHPEGRLGFHAPSLVVDRGLYDEATVSQSYSIALKTVGRILSVSEQLDFRNSLLERMIETPLEDMLYVDTVGKAFEWNITIDPVAPVDEISGQHVLNVCNNTAFAIPNQSLMANVLIERSQNSVEAEALLWEEMNLCRVHISNPSTSPSAVNQTIGWVTGYAGNRTAIHPYALHAPGTSLRALSNKP